MKIGNKAFLMNTGASDCYLKSGFIIAGFGKGGYKSRAVDEAFDANKEVSFSLDADSLVIFNGALVPVHGLLHERRKTDPMATIAYHRLVDSPTPENPAEFKIEKVHTVNFIPKGKVSGDEMDEEPDDTGTASSLQAKIACLYPTKIWTTRFCDAIYSVRWAANSSLMPIRPQVVLKNDLTLMPGHALPLC